MFCQTDTNIQGPWSHSLPGLMPGAGLMPTIVEMCKIESRLVILGLQIISFRRYTFRNLKRALSPQGYCKVFMMGFCLTVTPLFARLASS
jgi:hypothetical protein